MKFSLRFDESDVKRLRQAMALRIVAFDKEIDDYCDGVKPRPELLQPYFDERQDMVKLEDRLEKLLKRAEQARQPAKKKRR